mmetsp:Transcript_35932/g.78497  ORF Transcript_35932/g.78497 Transcript_35932/m.78497 type:complete len:222 (-) Transcript_35932:1103-1768(-)
MAVAVRLAVPVRAVPGEIHPVPTADHWLMTSDWAPSEGAPVPQSPGPVEPPNELAVRVPPGDVPGSEPRSNCESPAASSWAASNCTFAICLRTLMRLFFSFITSSHLLLYVWMCLHPSRCHQRIIRSTVSKGPSNQTLNPWGVMSTTSVWALNFDPRPSLGFNHVTANNPMNRWCQVMPYLTVSFFTCSGPSADNLLFASRTSCSLYSTGLPFWNLWWLTS